MKLTNRFSSAFRNHRFRILIAVVSVVSLSVDTSLLFGQQAGSAVQSPAVTTTTPAAEEAPKIPNDQLDSLVAPVALYPDPLLAQILAASTYPLEVIQLEQWLKRNPNLKQEALAEAMAKQTWDPSVQSLAIYPDVVTRLSENVAWTTDLGNAFLAQQSDVMSAIQRMRGKAQSKGTLKTTEQQKVETEADEGGTEVITIEQANPQYVYVPSYDPAIVYGPPVYPYPPFYYPGYVPGMGLAFGTGLILGAAWANHWGNCNWHGGGNVTINNKNNFNRNNINNINGGNRNQINNRPGNAGGGNWQHNPSHRGGAPYGDRGTANKYGGRARQQPAGGNRPGAGGSGIASRPGGGAGAGNSGAGNRPGAGGGAGNSGAGNRPGAGGGGTANRPGGGAGAGNVGGGNRPSAGTMPANRGGGSGNNVGNRGISSSSSFGSSSNAFGGGGGSSARSASSRGGSSMGGGISRGGGGGGSHGGGGRGGGGGRR